MIRFYVLKSSNSKSSLKTIYYEISTCHILRIFQLSLSTKTSNYHTPELTLKREKKKKYYHPKNLEILSARKAKPTNQVT